jgi:centromere protein Scm3/Myb-like DNA-binding protein
MQHLRPAVSDPELLRLKTLNNQRLRNAFEDIIDKYARDFTELGDEVDLESGSIVVNNGHIERMRDEHDTGEQQSLLNNWINDVAAPVPTASATTSHTRRTTTTTTYRQNAMYQEVNEDEQWEEDIEAPSPSRHSYRSASRGRSLARHQSGGPMHQRLATVDDLASSEDEMPAPPIPRTPQLSTMAGGYSQQGRGRVRENVTGNGYSRSLTQPTNSRTHTPRTTSIGRPMAKGMNIDREMIRDFSQEIANQITEFMFYFAGSMQQQQNTQQILNQNRPAIASSYPHDSYIDDEDQVYASRPPKRRRYDESPQLRSDRSIRPQLDEPPSRPQLEYPQSSRHHEVSRSAREETPDLDLAEDPRPDHEEPSISRVNSQSRSHFSGSSRPRQDESPRTRTIRDSEPSRSRSLDKRPANRVMAFRTEMRPRSENGLHPETPPRFDHDVQSEAELEHGINLSKSKHGHRGLTPGMPSLWSGEEDSDFAPRRPRKKKVPQQTISAPNARPQNGSRLRNEVRISESLGSPEDPEPEPVQEKAASSSATKRKSNAKTKKGITPKSSAKRNRRGQQVDPDEEYTPPRHQRVNEPPANDDMDLLPVYDDEPIIIPNTSDDEKDQIELSESGSEFEQDEEPQVEEEDDDLEDDLGGPTEKAVQKEVQELVQEAELTGLAGQAEQANIVPDPVPTAPQLVSSTTPQPRSTNAPQPTDTTQPVSTTPKQLINRRPSGNSAPQADEDSDSAENSANKKQYHPRIAFTEDDDRLIEKLRMEGWSWGQIAEHFPCHTAHQVMYRWRKYIALGKSKPRYKRISKKAYNPFNGTISAVPAEPEEDKGGMSEEYDPDDEDSGVVGNADLSTIHAAGYRPLRPATKTTNSTSSGNLLSLLKVMPTASAGVPDGLLDPLLPAVNNRPTAPPKVVVNGAQRHPKISLPNNINKGPTSEPRHMKFINNQPAPPGSRFPLRTVKIKPVRGHKLPKPIEHRGAWEVENFNDPRKKPWAT